MYVGQHGDTIAAQVQVRLERVGARVGGALEGGDGVLRVLGRVAPVRDALRRAEAGGFSVCPVSRAPSSLTSGGKGHGYLGVPSRA